MDTREIFDLLNLQFANKGLEYCPQEEEGGDPFVRVPADALVEVARFVQEDPRLDFKMLHCISGVDYQEHLTSVVHLYSIERKHKLVLKTDCPVEDPKVPSLSGVWKAADWHERESFDMIGIVYEGHPNLRRILLSEDWEGHPLRKDYTMPDDTLFPWEDEGNEIDLPKAESARPPRATAPGTKEDTLKRPEPQGQEDSPPPSEPQGD